MNLYKSHTLLKIRGHQRTKVRGHGRYLQQDLIMEIMVADDCAWPGV